MNERIRELSYEAQRYALNNTTGPDLAGLNELWQEKFAELIVRECIAWVDGSPATDAGQLLLTKSFITANLKGHFGVEE